MWLCGGLALLFAAVLVYLNWPHNVNAFAAVPARPYEIRVAYSDASRWLPLKGTVLGTTDPVAKPIPFASLNELQQRGDKYGVIIASAWNGEKPGDVAEELRTLATKAAVPSPSLLSDRAAFELLATTNDNLEPVLTDLEALKASTDVQAARAARWNYALVLSRMGLPFSAESEFQTIASEDEAGWAQEASKRAGDQRTLGIDAQKEWEKANAAGAELARTGATISMEQVRRFPGLMRAHLYEAVRAAPSRDRVVALLPIAVELDRLSRQSTLAAYVQRVANLDFRRRKPIAEAYGRILQGAPPPATLDSELNAPKPSADVADIVMGTMVRFGSVAQHLEAFRHMVKQADDPWHKIVLIEEEAALDMLQRNWLGAEAKLLYAQSQCSLAVQYQCLYVARQLGELYGELHRIPEAVRVLREALRIARTSVEWGRYRDLLWRLADVERFNTSTAMARAYANEILRMAPEGAAISRAAQMILVGAAILDVNGLEARHALNLALSDIAPSLAAANYLADIGRLDPQPGDLALLRSWLKSWLSQLEVNGALSPVHQLLAHEIEGRLLIESDRAAGTALLERAIQEAQGLPKELSNDPDAMRARTGAYSTLVLDASRLGDYPQAMTLTAQELGLPTPGPCTVAMVAEDERAVVLVRGNDGRDRATYERARNARDGTPRVSDELVHSLEGCVHVGVMAQAALQGQPRILPDTLPWSYTTYRSEDVSEPAKIPTAPRALTPLEQSPRVLIVTNVTPPANLQLSALSHQPVDRAAAIITLQGPEATPARVLDEMRDATIIRFHTHALVDTGISDASYLVLSEGSGADKKYQLTVEDIRSIKLQAHPIVVLAACNSAQGARYQHAPWSLPDAFLAAGARAVFAAGAQIPDLEAEPFFTPVLKRIQDGAAPAAALRDARIKMADSQPWVTEVILFE
jgi:hypothetical protein